MSSVFEAFSDAIMERAAVLKVIVYAIPIFLAANAYIGGQTQMFNFWKVLTAAMYLGALTFGIYSVRNCHETVLTLNPLVLMSSILKALLVIIPHIFIWYSLGSTVIKFIPNIDSIAHFDIVMQGIVWGIVGSIVIAAYINFASKMSVPQGFNFTKIFNSCIDVFVCIFFFIPQLLIADALIIFPMKFTFTYLEIPLTHWGFVWYCSMVAVINLSVLANFLAQTAYENIKLNDEDYAAKYIFNDIQTDDKDKGKDKLKKFF